MQTPSKNDPGSQPEKVSSLQSNRKIDIKSINLNFTPISAIKSGSHLINSVMKEHEERKKNLEASNRKEIRECVDL